MNTHAHTHTHTHTHTHAYMWAKLLIALSGAPGGLTISHSHSTSLRLSWTPVPKDQQKGIVTGYDLVIVGPDSIRKIPITDASINSIEVSDLRPFTQYTFDVSAVTVAGTGPAATISFTTPEGGKMLLYCQVF